MTIKEFLEYYKQTTHDKDWFMTHNFKPQWITTSNEYHIELPNTVNIYSYNYDGRRGIWINKFLTDNNKIGMIQICAGREGDDTQFTIVLEEEWFYQKLEELDIRLLKDTDADWEYRSRIIYLNIGDKMPNEEIIKEIGTYGTHYDETNKIKTILQEIKKKKRS
jgi:hypothetical protein